MGVEAGRRSGANGDRGRDGRVVPCLGSTQGPPAAPLTGVNLAAVADADDQDAEHAALNVGDDVVIADPVLPEFAEVRALQRPPEASRVLERGQPFPQGG